MQGIKNFRSHSIGLLVLLAIQYTLGMLVNLYVKFPPDVTTNQQWDFARDQWLLMAHIGLGMLILIGSIALWVMAIRAKDRVWKIASGLAFGSILLAIITGSEFISMQKEPYSFAMSLFFITAIASLSWGIYRSKS